MSVYTNNQIEQVNNLIKYFERTILKSESKKTSLSKQINKKALDIKEDEFKRLIGQFVAWVNPVDLLIMSINSIEKIKKQTNLKSCNKFTVLWIMCVLSAKYLSSHDHQSELSIEYLSNLGGFQLNDYIFFEKIILKKLDWKMEVAVNDYQRLVAVSNQPTNQPTNQSKKTKIIK